MLALFSCLAANMITSCGSADEAIYQANAQRVDDVELPVSFLQQHSDTPKIIDDVTGLAQQIETLKNELSAADGDPVALRRIEFVRTSELCGGVGAFGQDDLSVACGQTGNYWNVGSGKTKLQRPILGSRLAINRSNGTIELLEAESDDQGSMLVVSKFQICGFDECPSGWSVMSETSPTEPIRYAGPILATAFPNIDGTSERSVLLVPEKEDVYDLGAAGYKIASDYELTPEEAYKLNFSLAVRTLNRLQVGYDQVLASDGALIPISDGVNTSYVGVESAVAALSRQALAGREIADKLNALGSGKQNSDSKPRTSGASASGSNNDPENEFLWSETTRFTFTEHGKGAENALELVTLSDSLDFDNVGDFAHLVATYTMDERALDVVVSGIASLDKGFPACETLGNDGEKVYVSGSLIFEPSAYFQVASLGRYNTSRLEALSAKTDALSERLRLEGKDVRELYEVNCARERTRADFAPHAHIRISVAATPFGQEKID